MTLLSLASPTVASCLTVRLRSSYPLHASLEYPSPCDLPSHWATGIGFCQLPYDSPDLVHILRSSMELPCNLPVLNVPCSVCLGYLILFPRLNGVLLVIERGFSVVVRRSSAEIYSFVCGGGARLGAKSLRAVPAYSVDIDDLFSGVLQLLAAESLLPSLADLLAQME